MDGKWIPLPKKATCIGFNNLGMWRDVTHADLIRIERWPTTQTTERQGGHLLQKWGQRSLATCSFGTSKTVLGYFLGVTHFITLPHGQVWSRVQNQKWLLNPYRLEGPHVGRMAT